MGCRHHLFLDVNKYGSITFLHGQDIAALERMKDTCSLDVAENGPMQFWDMAEYFNRTNESVRLWYQQAEDKARKLATLKELA